MPLLSIPNYSGVVDDLEGEQQIITEEWVPGYTFPYSGMPLPPFPVIAEGPYAGDQLLTIPTYFWGLWGDSGWWDYWPSDDTQEKTATSITTFRSKIYLRGKLVKTCPNPLVRTTTEHSYFHAIQNCDPYYHGAVWTTRGAIMPSANSERHYEWTTSGDQFGGYFEAHLTEWEDIYSYGYNVNACEATGSRDEVGYPPNDIAEVTSETENFSINNTKWYLNTSGEDWLLWETDDIYGSWNGLFLTCEIYEWEKDKTTGKPLPVYAYSFVKDAYSENLRRIVYGLVYKDKKSEEFKHCQTPDIPVDGGWFHEFSDKSFGSLGENKFGRGVFRPGRLVKKRKWAKYVY